MSITLRDALARFTVPELKDLVSHLPGAETAGRKDEVIERIVVGMFGSGLKAIWSGLDETQQAAIAEAVHDPLGEYSEQRFRAKYQQCRRFKWPAPNHTAIPATRARPWACSFTTCAMSVAT